MADATVPPAPPVAGAGPKNVIVSLVLNFFFPGVAEIYLGLPKKGVIMLVAYFGLWVVSFVLTLVLIGCCLMTVPLIIWLYGLYDAYTLTDKVNRGVAVKDWLS